MTLYKEAQIRQSANIVRENVTVEIVEINASVPLATGKVEWKGTLRPPNNTGLLKGQIYKLVLPGYSPTKILITSEAHPVDGVVEFEGIGKAPFPSEQVHGAS